VYVSTDMNWLASIAVGILTAIAGMFAAGLVGGLLVEWYQVSSFEGGAGFFVVAVAIFGLMGSFVVGVVTSRVVAAKPNPGFAKALGLSTAIVAGILTLIAAGARLADVPPTLDGDTLFLQVELRWPASGGSDPRTMPGAGYTRLGTSTGSVVRRQENGPLFVEDARQEDGRWVVPGAVDVFTSRGQRVLEIGVGDTRLAAFMVPLPGHPRQEQRTWSDWLPRPGDLPPDQFTYRFRVVRQSEPIRSERAGPFQVDEVVRYFYNVQGTDRMAANASFRIHFKGKPVPGFDEAQSVALVAAAKTALLVQAELKDRDGVCHLVIDEGEQARIETIPSCSSPIDVEPVTSDAARFQAAKDAEAVPGWVDRTSLETPGLYKTGDTILDTRTLAHWTYTTPSPRPISSVPPLGVSPDERSMIRFAHDGSEDRPVLVVVDFQANRSYSIPIDRRRMRYGNYETIDPAWVAHHFEWTRPDDRTDVLAERRDFIPLPYKGEFTAAKAGEYQSYTMRPGKERLRSAIVEILMAEPGAERLADELNGYYKRVRIDDRVLNVTLVESVSYVNVSMETGKEEPDFMTRIARRLDAAFATGKYDDAFDTPKPDQ
jgi:hypothetical protein